MSGIDLVLADIASIQDYIVSPRKLKRNRGASQILKEYNKRDLRRQPLGCSAEGPNGSLLPGSEAASARLHRHRRFENLLRRLPG